MLLVLGTRWHATRPWQTHRRWRGPATASCVEGRSGEARDAVAPVHGACLKGFDAVVLRRVLQVREQRLGLVGRADLEVFADGQVVDGGEEDRVAHDAGDGVDDELVRAWAVDDAGAARVDLAVSAAVVRRNRSPPPWR